MSSIGLLPPKFREKVDFRGFSIPTVSEPSAEYSAVYCNTDITVDLYPNELAQDTEYLQEFEDTPSFSLEVDPYKTRKKNGEEVIRTGIRNYFRCTYKKMFYKISGNSNKSLMARRSNHFYLRLFHALRLGCDFDMEYANVKSPYTHTYEYMMQVWHTCASWAVDEMKKHAPPDSAWHCVDYTDTRESTLVADSKKKFSRHIIFHFNDSNTKEDIMFVNNNACGYFVSLVMNRSIELFSFEQNPLFFWNGIEWHPIPDSAVYDNGRSWRGPYCTKNNVMADAKLTMPAPPYFLPYKITKMDDDASVNEDGTFVDPYKLEVDTSGDEYTMCSEAQFFSHFPTFVRVHDGVKNPVKLLHMPEVLRHRSDGTFIGGGKRRAAVGWAQSVSDFVEGKVDSAKKRKTVVAGDNSNRRMASLENRYANETPEEKVSRMSVTPMFYEGMSGLQANLGLDHMKMGRIYPDKAVLISYDSHWCPHKGADHESNLVFFIICLGVDMPYVYYFCQDDMCEPAYRRAVDPVKKIRVKLDKRYFAKYKAMMLEYLCETTISSSDLNNHSY